MIKLNLSIAIATCISSITGLAQIANMYPSDIGIQAHPMVIHADMFEQTSLGTMLGAYNTSGVSTNFSFDPSVPPGSTGTQSCRLTTIESGNGTQPNEDTYLFKRFAPGVVGDSIFVRYYVKFNNSHTSHHSGVWIGGNNPPTAWPNSHAGHLPAGDQAFHVGSEIRGSVTQTAQNTAPFGFFNYWMNMRQSTQFDSTAMDYYYWGNEFLSPDPEATIDLSAWNCIEVMVKLNNPVTGSTGELALWINGVKVGHYGQGFPNGNWNPNNFIENAAGSPFEGFQWRDDAALELNYIWLKNYSTNNANYTSANDILYDHLVVAKSYIGPISLAVGLDEKGVPAITMAPNPADQTAQFSAPIENLEIYNSQGSRVAYYPEAMSTIGTSDLPTGIYLLKGDQFMQRLMIRH